MVIAMKCVLHIGTEKTGTTLLQDWLYANEALLNQQRIYLPQTLGKSNNRLLASYFEPGIDDWAKTHHLTTIEQKAAYFSDFEEKFREEVQQASESHDVFLISSEHFHSRIRWAEDIENLRRLLDETFEQVTVVCYFRDQADMVISNYSTAVRGETTQNLAEFLQIEATPDNYYYNIKAIADNWSSVFGRNRCTFRVYDRQQFPDQDIRRDFISVLPTPLDSTGFDFTVQNSNESLGPLAATACRKINEIVPYWDPVKGGVSELNLKLKTEIESSASLQAGNIESTEKNAIRLAFESSNEAFFRDYLQTENQFASSQTAFGNNSSNSDSINNAEQAISDLCDVFLKHVGYQSNDQLQKRDAIFLRDLANQIEHENVFTLRNMRSLILLALRQKFAKFRERLSSQPSK